MERADFIRHIDDPQTWAGNVATANELSGCGDWSTASDDLKSRHFLAIKKSICEACRCMYANEALRDRFTVEQLTLVVSGGTADRMQDSDEIRWLTSKFPAPQVSGWLLPRVLYGIHLTVIDDLTPDRLWLKNPTSAIVMRQRDLAARVVDSIDGVPVGFLITDVFQS